MTATRLCILLALALATGACGKRPSGEESARAVAQAPAEAATSGATSAAPPPTHARKAVRLNEDGSETMEETAGDAGTHNTLLTAVASTMAASAGSARAATLSDAASPWQPGLNYTPVVPAQPISVAPGQVEVLEFFWYGCPHCNAIDPQVEAWKKTKASYISFSRVPVLWSEGHRATARLFYTLENLGKLDQLHPSVFKEIHVKGDPLVAEDPNDSAGAERLQTAFVQQFGISADAFGKAYHSFAVETALQRADQLVLRYHVDSVPTFVVNGRYIADVRSAGGPDKILPLIDYLAAAEHRR